MKSDRMKVLQMDVCSDQEVAQAVDFVKRTLKEPEEGTWGSLYFQHNWLFAGQVIPCLHHPKRVNKPGGLRHCVAGSQAVLYLAQQGELSCCSCANHRERDQDWLED